MADEQIIAALDIGTTKVVALVGEMDERGGIYVIGHGISPAEGLRRGVVVDMDKTVRSIQKAVEDAQMVSGTVIDRVTVGIAGEHVRSINSHGVVAVSRSDKEVTPADVQKAIEAARTVAIPADREIIHVIPQEFSVDDQNGVKDPTGMSGVRLEVEAHIVTASVTTARNIYRALERCRLGIDHIVLESLGLANIHLTPREMNTGAVIIDIGGDITNMALFYDGAIRSTAAIPLGSRNVTNDIAIGLRTTLDQAEELKIGYGAALASMVDPEEMVNVTGVGGRASRDISRNVLASIVEPRMEEILSLIARELKKIGRSDNIAAGMVLTGGGSMLPGTVELAEQLFDVPVRLGQVKGLTHVPDELNSVRFATAHGLLLYGFANEANAATSSGAVKGWWKRIEGWITKQF
ncbi:MAG: cell division protein FtsA [bacterium]|nr:cell division protein FtsA [bacterium]